MKKNNFSNLSSPNLGISNLGKNLQNTKSTAAIFSNAAFEKKGPWMCAWKDPLANIKTISNCIKLGDVKGDGEARLLIADQNQKFSIYKGTTIETEYNLIDVPLAITLFYSEVSKNRNDFSFFYFNNQLILFSKAIPNIAIVCESAVFIYKNLKPYFKFVLHVTEIPKEEAEIWSRFPEKENFVDLLKALNKIKAEGIDLSYKSNDLLSCQDFEEQKKLFESYKELLTIPDMPTCIQVLKKQSEEETALSNLILGTELKSVLVLDSQGTSILKKIKLPSAPFQILAHGLLEFDYRLIVACRDDRVYFIRNGEVII